MGHAMHSRGLQHGEVLDVVSLGALRSVTSSHREFEVCAVIRSTHGRDLDWQLQ